MRLGSLTPWAPLARAHRVLRSARATRLSVPVISVGNLAFGGRGKTPFVRVLVEELRGFGCGPVGVVSRGYGGGGSWPRHVSVNSDPRRVGDEPRMLAADPDLIVVVDPARPRGGALAIELGAQVLVLDDGFQHPQLHRDLDLLLFHSADVGAACPPWGPLRAPWSMHRHADGRIAVDDDPCEAHAILETEIVRIGGGAPETWRGREAAVLAGIARPERVARLLTACGIKVIGTRWLRDHQPFGPRDVEMLRSQAEGAPVLVTEKDAARWPLGRPMPFEVVEVRQRWVRGRSWLQDKLRIAVEQGG